MIILTISLWHSRYESPALLYEWDCLRLREPSRYAWSCQASSSTSCCHAHSNLPTQEYVHGKYPTFLISLPYITNLVLTGPWADAAGGTDGFSTSLGHGSHGDGSGEAPDETHLHAKPNLAASAAFLTQGNTPLLKDKTWFTYTTPVTFNIVFAMFVTS